MAREKRYIQSFLLFTIISLLTFQTAWAQVNPGASEVTVDEAVFVEYTSTIFVEPKDSDGDIVDIDPDDLNVDFEGRPSGRVGVTDFEPVIIRRQLVGYTAEISSSADQILTGTVEYEGTRSALGEFRTKFQEISDRSITQTVEDNALADGEDEVIIGVQLIDDDDESPISGIRDDDFELNFKAAGPPEVESIEEDSDRDGIYFIAITNTEDGSGSYELGVAGRFIGSDSFTFEPAGPIVDAGTSEVDATTPHAPDGSDMSEVTIQVRDSDGSNLFTEVSLSDFDIELSGSAALGDGGENSSAQEFFFLVTNDVEEIVTVTVNVEDPNTGETVTLDDKPEIEFVAVPETELSSISATSPHIANGSDPSVVTLEIRDGGNNAIETLDSDDFDISLSTPNASATDVGHEGAGEYQFEVTSTDPEQVRVTVDARDERIGTVDIIFQDAIEFVDPRRSEIADATSPHVADGEDASLVTVVLRDNDGDEIDGVSSNSLSISVEEGDEGSLDIGSFSSTGNTGEFEAEITSTQAGDYEIAVDVDDTRIAGTETIEFTEPSISASSSSVDATSPHLADGSDASTVTVNIVNEIGDSVDDLGNDDFNISLTGSASATNVSNEGGGEYQFEVTNNVVETITVTVTADGTELDDNPEIIFEADDQVDPELSDVSTSDDSADADGEDEIIITVELRNSQNQPINDFDSSDFDIDVSNNGSAADVEQVDDDGTYEFGVTNNQPGTTEIDIEAGGTSLPTVTVEFEEIETFVDGSSSSVDATSPHDADGSDASTVTVSLIDDQGDAMDDVSTGSFDIDVSGNGQVASDVSNEGGGEYEFLVTNNTAETVTVTVTVQGIELDDTPEIVFEAVDIDIPEPPVIGEIVDVDTGIELRWEVGSMDIISEFIIYRGASAGNLEPYATVPSGETTFVDEDPLAGTNFYAISAVNELEEEGDISNLVSFYNGEILSTGDWQMISTPVDGTHSVDSDVTLFSFSNRYEHENSISQGEGFWMKTSDDSSLEFSIRGEGLTQLSLSLNEGWNMVGGLADNIPITSISDTDNVLTDAPVYHYTNGEYVSVDQIEPDKGYWLYASEAGSVDLQIAADQNVMQEDLMASSQTKREVEGEKPALKFSSGNMTAKLEIAENSLSQEQKYAYLLPPLAPEPKLDVRTKDGYRIIGPEGESLAITATQYPVMVTLDDHQAMSDAVYQLVLQKDNRERIVELSSNSPVELMEDYDNVYLTTTETTEIIEEHKLLPNYPNPFNPTTTLQYQLSENTHVTLEVYDVSGRRVQVLENGTQQAGLHNAQFDGSNMASGMYMVRFHAGDQVQIQKITLIK